MSCSESLSTQEWEQEQEQEDELGHLADLLKHSGSFDVKGGRMAVAVAAAVL
jgi:hypothetical protein